MYCVVQYLTDVNISMLEKKKTFFSHQYLNVMPCIIINCVLCSITVIRRYEFVHFFSLMKTGHNFNRKEIQYLFLHFTRDLFRRESTCFK